MSVRFACHATGLDAVQRLEQKKALIELALSNWITIVSACYLASETGRIVIKLGNLEAQKEGSRRIVQSIIGTRSLRTASSRANLAGFHAMGL